jgi:hypothetical protein
VITRIEPQSSPAAALRELGMEPREWSAPPRTHFARHQHERTKRLFVLRGDISFNGDWLHAPAAIRIDAGTPHDADVGDGGVDCVEAFE